MILMGRQRTPMEIDKSVEAAALKQTKDEPNNESKEEPAQA